MLILSESRSARRSPTGCSLTGIPGDLRSRVLGGAVQPLGQLTEEELVTMREMLIKGEAEIISSASKPYLIAKLS
jgi:hypothetical protein